MGDRAAGRARERRPEDEERRLAAEPDAPVRPAEEVLALQQAAGNRAVSAMLARTPGGRAPADAKAPAASGTRAELSGIGTIALLSVSLDPGRLGRPGPGGAGTPQPAPPSEIALMSKLGAHSTALSKAALDGKPMTVEIVMVSGQSTVKVTLEDALVSSYSTSGAEGETIESWTLNFRSLKYGDGQDKPAPGPDRSTWDLSGPRG
jgi:hypothetical protein